MMVGAKNDYIWRIVILWIRKISNMMRFGNICIKFTKSVLPTQLAAATIKPLYSHPVNSQAVPQTAPPASPYAPSDKSPALPIRNGCRYCGQYPHSPPRHAGEVLFDNDTTAVCPQFPWSRMRPKTADWTSRHPKTYVEGRPETWEFEAAQLLTYLQHSQPIHSCGLSGGRT